MPSVLETNSLILSAANALLVDTIEKPRTRSASLKANEILYEVEDKLRFVLYEVEEKFRFVLYNLY